MVLFSFITPQFESGAQNEVTMLRPDSPSSCLPARWRSRDLPLLGQGFPLTVSILIGTPAGRRAQGKLTMRFKTKQQNKTDWLCIANCPGFIRRVYVDVFHDSTPARTDVWLQDHAQSLGAGLSQRHQDVLGTSSLHEEGPPSPLRSTGTGKNRQSRQL